MELKLGRDFFFRPYRGSDRAEVLALVEQYQNLATSEALAGELISSVNSQSENGAPDTQFFQVMLNSNGVLIGVVRVQHEILKILAVNPNFRKKELKEALYRALQEWSAENNLGRIDLAPKLVVGDWKAFFKQSGAKIENDGSGREWMQLSKK